MAKSWTTQETSYLGRYASKKTLDELAQRFETDGDSVRAKLAAMGLRSKDGEPIKSGPTSLADDPEVRIYGEAVKALHGKKWKEAEKLLAEVIEKSDRAELIERARQNLSVVRRYTGDGKPAAIGDPYVEAVFEKNRGDFAAARQIVTAQAKKDADGRFAYLAASLHAVEGQQKDAARALEKAVAADPGNRVRAYHDPDFGELRKEKDHAHLFGLD